MKRALTSTMASLAAALLLAVALESTAVAQSATVMTDQADYAPGTIVTITGSGWQPGETVTLSLVESPLVDTHPDLTAVADANGNIFNNQFSPDDHDADITFTSDRHRGHIRIAGTDDIYGCHYVGFGDRW